MADLSGSFFGYREFEPGLIGRITLDLWELPGKVPHEMKVYPGGGWGDAPDAYGDMVTFPWQSIIVLIMAKDNNALFQLSSDGVNYQDEGEIDPKINLGAWFHRYAAYGFRIKNKSAGLVSRYQVMAFR